MGGVLCYVSSKPHIRFCLYLNHCRRCFFVTELLFCPFTPPLFCRNDTEKLPFTLLDGSTQDSPLMYINYEYGTAIQVANVPALLPNNAQIPCLAVKLMYKTGEYSAVIAMPQGELGSLSDGKLTLANGVDYAAALSSCREAVVAGLSPSGADGSAASGTAGTTITSGTLEWKLPGDAGVPAIKVWLPRFEVAYETSLVPALRALGVTGVFQSGDLTEIAESPAGESLAVSDVVHKVYVKVDEQGTEAAAVTGIIAATSMPMAPEPDVLAKFDRPFVFTIVHERTKVVLFAGEMYKPEEWTE